MIDYSGIIKIYDKGATCIIVVQSVLIILSRK